MVFIVKPNKKQALCRLHAANEDSLGHPYIASEGMTTKNTATMDHSTSQSGKFQFDPVCQLQLNQMAWLANFISIVIAIKIHHYSYQIME